MAEATPTWQYVQGVVSSNIAKADAAYSVARSALQNLAQAYQGLDTFHADPRIGAYAGIDWPNAIVAPAQPEEPEYDAPDAPSLRALERPSAIAVPSAPGAEIDLSGQPGAMAPAAELQIPALEQVPLVDVVVPIIDPQALTASFAFDEPAYDERVSPLVRAGIERVLSGDMGIPQPYWDAIWAEAANDLARQQQAALRNARNRGAASHWGLPSESVLAASRAVQDDTARQMSQTRLEQAKQRAVFAREDFWQGIQQGIAYEQQWVDFHQATANRSLAAAEQSVKLAIEIHNGRIAQHNLLLEAAKLTGEISNLKTQSTISRNAQKLQILSAQLEGEKFKVERFQAEWQGYQIEKTMHIQSVAERVRWWNGLVDAHARYETLHQQKGDLDLRRYGAMLSKIETISRAVSAVLTARTGAQSFDIEKQRAVFGADQAKNAAALDRARIQQEAQRALADMDAAQLQWLGSQGIELLKAIATNSVGMYQALLTVSDVNLSSSWSGSASDSTTASRNEDLRW